ncbi:MAG: hypothetical protein RIM23_19865 [Coleofasciculus sp. G3-WIS-01]|uniref:hypothetical protein n=1 Tax=Coleofasciculus sp. G3-WIS-01 TaxID=3069528 RepID=UPI0032F38F7B
MLEQEAFRSLGVGSSQCKDAGGGEFIIRGRRIKTLLETRVERPLNRCIFEHYPDLNALAERQFIVGLEDKGLPVIELPLASQSLPGWLNNSILKS